MTVAGSRSLSPRVACKIGGMTDQPTPEWTRLAEHVVARRVQLGYRKRPAFTDASGISTRILGDIETARRNSYDPTTIAKLEQALKWATGSVNSILAGAEPTALDTALPTGMASQPTTALEKVMRADNLTDEQKKKIVTLLIGEREAFDRRIAEQADELIRMFGG